MENSARMSPEDVKKELLARYSMPDLRLLLEFTGFRDRAKNSGDSLLIANLPVKGMLAKLRFSDAPFPADFQSLVELIDKMLNNSRCPIDSPNRPVVPNSPPLAPEYLYASKVHHPKLGAVFVTEHAWRRFLSRVHGVQLGGHRIFMKDRPELAAHLQQMFASSVITRLTDGGEVRRMIDQRFIPTFYLAEPSGRFRFVVSKTQPYSMFTCEPVLARRIPRVQPPNRLRHK